jgi:FKBP-type peptidyl-prolyl cis-trans isomerase
MKYYSILLLVLVSFAACEKEEKSQEEIDDQIINNYLSENNRDAEYFNYGLYYSIIEEGSAEHPEITDSVVVKYKGYLTNNQVFGETKGDETLKHPLSGLIPGWQLGLPLIGRGGKQILYIPSSLGYGSYAAGNIPPNSVLIFEIELVDFY